MRRLSITLMLLMAMIFVAGASAQSDVLKQQFPIDNQVRYGVLPNGLTYYIRHNEEPKNRAEFHIAQKVGSILEEENQRGLAHFLEHMAFNGLEHFPGKQMLEYFQSIGLTFGGDINAYTSFDRTVYRLSNVPTEREAVLDSALLVLHDWSCAITLDEKEIDAERGVINEEWRTRGDANQRLYESVKSGNEAQISIDSNSQPDYRDKLNEELRALRESEMWQTAVTVRKLRPENN